ncbi:MAG: MFS transporter [Actinomycetales bacterium]|nr:MAG: MFS transporter [Actinomycetales bacterium]
MIKRPSWLTKNLATISWVSLLQDAASEMLYPIMPIFLYSVLGAPAVVVGLIEGIAEGTMAFFKLISSWLNRWLPRRAMVFLGYLGAALGKLIIALSGIWQFVLMGRVVDRVGKGIRSAARDAILVQGVESSHRGRTIGFHRAADSTGAVIGPILTLLFLSLFDGDIRSVLWVAVIPAFASALLVLAIKDHDLGSRKRRPKTSVAAKEAQKLNPKITKLIWLLALFALINFPDALLLLHLNQDGFTPVQVVSAYLLFNISYASLSFPLGLLTDRLKPQNIYAIGLVAFAITYIGLGISHSKFIAAILLVIYGGFAAANDVVGKTWVSKLALDSQQFVVQARLQGLSGFGILFAGLWAGLLWNFGSGFGTLPLLISGTLGLCAALAISRFK